MSLPHVLALFLPDEFAILLIMGLGLAVIVGLVRPMRALLLIGMGALLYALSPVVEALFAALPLWALLAVLLWAGLAIARGVLVSLLGREAAGHVLGTFVVWVIAATLRAGLASIRLVLQLALRLAGARR